MTGINNQQAHDFLKKSILALSNIPEELIERLFSICRSIPYYKKGQFFSNGRGYSRILQVKFKWNISAVLCWWKWKWPDQGLFHCREIRHLVQRFGTTAPVFFLHRSVGWHRCFAIQLQPMDQMVEEDIRWYPFLFKLLETVYIMKNTRKIIPAG